MSKEPTLKNLWNHTTLNRNKAGGGMTHYDEFFKAQYERIQKKLDLIEAKLIFNKQFPNDQFLDNPKFMELMGISGKTAQSWRDKGIIGYSQIGSKIYYRLSDIRELLEKHHIHSI
mgnify:CR=1 FL=1